MVRFPFEDIGINKSCFLKVVIIFWCYGIIVSPSKSQPKWAVLSLTTSNYVLCKCWEGSCFWNRTIKRELPFRFPQWSQGTM